MQLQRAIEYIIREQKYECGDIKSGKIIMKVKDILSLPNWVIGALNDYTDPDLKIEMKPVKLSLSLNIHGIICSNLYAYRLIFKKGNYYIKLVSKYIH